MSGARGVAEVYQAQWTAHLSRAVANAFCQMLAEKPPDPVARIGRLLTATVDGPAPHFVPPPSTSPSNPLSQPPSDDAFNARWSAHINATTTQAWKQTFVARPADPVVHLGRLLLAASTAAADVRTLKEGSPPLEPLPPPSEADAPGNRRRLSIPKEDSAEDQGEWSLVAWARGAGVHRVVAAAIQRGAADKTGKESVTDSEAIRGFLRGLIDKSELAPLFGTGPVADAVTDLVWLEVEKLQAVKALANDDVMGKFGGAIELSFFGLDKFFSGLGGIVGEPSPKVRAGMKAEHLQGSESTDTFMTGNYGIETKSQIEWLFVVGTDEEQEQLQPERWPEESEKLLPDREKCRVRRTQYDLHAKIEVHNKQLVEANQPKVEMDEVIAAQLYTGPMFEKYNAVLRGLQSESDFLKNNMIKLCCPKDKAKEYQGTAKISELANGTLPFEEAKKSLNIYTTTLHAVNSAVIKLGKLTKAQTVYRGIGGKALPKEFWTANDFNVRGGVEPAFMSTTLNREVAMTYASGSGVGIVLAIRQGMVNRGADLSWLSQYPHEQEVLFGPLTGIEVLSTKIDGSVVLIECDFSINLTALTLEQVQGKRRNLIDQMSEQIVDQQINLVLKGTGFAEQGVALMKDEVAVARKDPEWYNEDANFLAAVQAVLDAKARVLGAARLDWIARLAVVEAEQHAPFVLESAKSRDEKKVRLALTVFNSTVSGVLESAERADENKVRVALTALNSFELESAERADENKVRVALTVLNSFEGFTTWKALMEDFVDERTGRVTKLQLKGCGLKGRLPRELAFLSDLETLDLRYNPDLDEPTYARDLGLLMPPYDEKGQMYFTDKGRVQAFLKHVALPEGKKEEAWLLKKHGADGPALKRIYDEGSPKFESGHWFDKEKDLSKWHGVSVDEEGRVLGLELDISLLSESVGELNLLQTLKLKNCSGLQRLPKRLGQLKTLQKLHLDGCKGLLSLPDLSGLAQLKVEYLPRHLQGWKASGYKAFSFATWLDTQVEEGMLTELWCPTSLPELPAGLGGLKALQNLFLEGCSGLLSLPERLSECTALQKLDLYGCSGLLSLPEQLGELKTLTTLDLAGCSGLLSLPDLSGLAELKVKNLPSHLQPWAASGYKALSFSKAA